MANNLNAKASHTFKIKLEQLGKKVVRGVSAQLAVEAERVAQIARNYAPVDEHNLEQAIEVVKESGGRNALGQFTRNSYTIRVNGSAVGSGGGKRGRRVGAYAWQMHQYLLPYGAGGYNLGPKSIEKRRSGNDVGGLFMTRALADSRDDIYKNCVNAVSQALKGKVNVDARLIPTKRKTRGI